MCNIKKKEKSGALILSRKFWPKFVEGLLDGSYHFVDFKLFYKLEQLMIFLKRWGNTPDQ